MQTFTIQLNQLFTKFIKCITAHGVLIISIIPCNKSKEVVCSRFSFFILFFFFLIPECSLKPHDVSECHLYLQERGKLKAGLKAVR